MKLSSYENPISGTRGNLFNIGNLWSQILGVVVLVMVFVFGQKLADMAFGKSGLNIEETPTTTTRILL
jgi:hypothetical protein